MSSQGICKLSPKFKRAAEEQFAQEQSKIPKVETTDDSNSLKIIDSERLKKLEQKVERLTLCASSAVNFAVKFHELFGDVDVIEDMIAGPDMDKKDLDDLFGPKTKPDRFVDQDEDQDEDEDEDDSDADMWNATFGDPHDRWARKIEALQDQYKEAIEDTDAL